MKFGLLCVQHYVDQAFHGSHGQFEVVEFVLKNLEYVTYDFVEVGASLSQKLTAFLDVGTDLGQDELWIYLAVALHKCLAQKRRHEVPAWILDNDIVPLDYVADMGGD